MLTSLFENIVSPQNKKFWLVFNIPSDNDERSLARLDGLAKGVLHGIKGVSSSREIVTEWFDIARNACLVMDAQKCIELNSLQEVLYHDIDSLCANNLEILSRLFNHGPDSHYNMMSTIMYYVRPASDSHPRDISKWSRLWEEIRWRAAQKWKDNPHGVNNSDDLCDLIIGVIAEAPSHIREFYERMDLRPVVKNALERMGRLYESESEWIVRSDVFRVPTGSILMISQNKQMVELAKKWKENPNQLELNEMYYTDILTQLENIEKFHLDKRYIIRFIDSPKFSKVRDNLIFDRKERQN